MIQFENMKPLHKADFVRQFNLFNDVMSGNVAPIRKPSTLKLSISDPDGDYDISFTNIPWNNAMMALRQDCGKN